jgi:hypothetical protein
MVLTHCPTMPQEERALVPTAIWEGCGRDMNTAVRFLCICDVESSMRCRRWFPQVKQNMDLAGTHNQVLCLELYREGLITDSKYWMSSKQWAAWSILFKKRPDVGTMIAARAFTRIVYKNSLDDSTEIWRWGNPCNVNGILYLMQVKSLEKQMMLGQRATARKN